jgi:hypothetical protein
MPETGAAFIAPGNRVIHEHAALPAISPISVVRFVAGCAAERAGEIRHRPPFPSTLTGIDTGIEGGGD